MQVIHQVSTATCLKVCNMRISEGMSPGCCDLLADERIYIRVDLSHSGLHRRTGLLAIKAGMTQEWDEWGKLIPLTVLWIDECEVAQSFCSGSIFACVILTLEPFQAQPLFSPLK